MVTRDPSPGYLRFPWAGLGSALLLSLGFSRELTFPPRPGPLVTTETQKPEDTPQWPPPLTICVPGTKGHFCWEINLKF